MTSLKAGKSSTFSAAQDCLKWRDVRKSQTSLFDFPLSRSLVYSENQSNPTSLHTPARPCCIHTHTHSKALCFLSSCGSATMKYEKRPMILALHYIQSCCRRFEVGGDGSVTEGRSIGSAGLSRSPCTLKSSGGSTRNQDPFWTDGNRKLSEHRKASSFHGMKMKE